ncbi:MAG: chromate transporter [Bacteroidaceae bacterium]|nr:chromate transporter [Bacteroidaceae bacterium]MBP5691340.1 chromate transporter [Bacteroidaceae bacterium]
MLFDLFFTFFKIGLFTIGGGYAMIPLLQREVVERKGWLSNEDFLDLMAIAQSAPGVFVVNMSIFVGYRMRGKRGSVACALGAAMPSIIIILAIALFVGNYKDNPVVENVFKGIRPAVIALILTPTIRLASKAGLNKWNWWVPVATALLIWWMGVSPVWIILAAIVGAILYYILKLRKA